MTLVFVTLALVLGWLLRTASGAHAEVISNKAKVRRFRRERLRYAARCVVVVAVAWFLLVAYLRG